MKIAILTSGGDSAGMNAVVRAVVKAGILKSVLCFDIPVFLFNFDVSEVVKLGLYEKDTKALFVVTAKQDKPFRVPRSLLP